MKRILLLTPVFLLLLTACGQSVPSTRSMEQTAIAQSILDQMSSKQTELASTPAVTLQPAWTDTPTPPVTPSPTATLAPVPHQKGEYIYAPILLYHHVKDENTQDRYNISLGMFNAEMQALQSWGYTSITISKLADVIRNGGELPTKPILITFDDGDIDVYENAYPIMKKYGFVGTFYIVANRVGADQFVSAEQVKEMAADGWEIGCHGYAHLDMSQDHNAIQSEGYEAKKALEQKLGLQINSFAYPYGGWDATVGSYTAGYGYTSGAGLGNSYIHDRSTLYYLSRMEVWGTQDMNGFAKMLPWSPVSTPMPLVSGS